MLLRFLTVAVSAAALSACNPDKRPSVDPATLQTPATEAVLRYTIEHCPKRKEAKIAVIGIGEFLAQPTPEFVEKFKDVPGLEFIDHQRVVAGMVAGKSRRFVEATKEPVLELQIGSITEPKDGKQTAVAAWAFMDDAERKRLEVKAKAGGGYDIRELENIPVTNRNDDRSSAGK
jgi:hypothetical protein